MKLSPLILLFGAYAAAAEPSDPRAALEAHRWFDLRDSVLAGHTAPIYRFFVAAAFNDAASAERELAALTRTGATRDQLAHAHHDLYRLYVRLGRYSRASIEFQRFAALANNPPSAAEIADADTMGKLPDQRVESRRPASLAYINWPNWQNVVAPVAINGQPAQYVLDSDASMSGASEAEARRLGLTIIEGKSLFDGITGSRTANFRYAVADRLQIGNTEIRNAAFLVVPDSLEAFSGIPANRRGFIGLPVLCALETLRWNRAHELRIGFPGARRDLRRANLAFEETDPLTTIEVQGRRLAVDLDTGSTRTFLWPAFVKGFPELLRATRKENTSMMGATGAAHPEAAILPELRFQLAGFPIALRDLPALLAPTFPVSNWQYGQLGMDTLSQAAELSLDFRALRLDLR